MAQGVRGTRDFYPEDMRLRNWLFNRFHEASLSHGFEEYDAPIIEHEDLYTRKQGEEITQQLYNFEDKGGRRVSLRPEMTPSLARMVMARSGALPLPIKWYSIPQCWRYERTQRGRGREHYQWNVDIWGMDGIEADAELLSVMVSLFRSVGLTSEDVVIKISSRKVLEEVLGSLGIVGESFAKTCVIVDKMDKLPAEAITAQLSDLGLDGDSISTIQSVLGISNLSDLSESLDQGSTASTELESLFLLIDSYGISDWVQFDASIVRGLAYYTGPVFEAHDRSGNLPATGFGFGDMVIMELLSDKGLLPDISSRVSDVVFCMDESLRGAAMSVSSKLRESGRKVDLVLEGKKMKWVFKHAERTGAERLVMLMPDEWSSGKVRIKDLGTGDESDIAFDSL